MGRVDTKDINKEEREKLALNTFGTGCQQFNAANMAPVDEDPQAVHTVGQKNWWPWLKFTMSRQLFFARSNFRRKGPKKQMLTLLSANLSNK